MMRASAASAPRARPAFSIRLLMMLFAAAVTLPLLLYLAFLIAHSFQSARQKLEEVRLHVHSFPTRRSSDHRKSVV